MSNVSIQSEADLEIVLLHENYDLLATIIGPELYAIYGERPDQEILFHNSSSFAYFLILVVELFAEGSRAAFIEGKSVNISLFDGMKRFRNNYPQEASESRLVEAIAELETWLEDTPAFDFWCGEVWKQITFPLENRQLINFCANATKHSIVKLNVLFEKLQRHLMQAGYEVTAQELVPVLKDFLEEAENRLLYHATYIIELLGKYFLAINEVISARWEKNPTNRVKEITIPAGYTSDVYLYGSVLVFQRCDNRRIIDYTPTTSKYFKLRYRTTLKNQQLRLSTQSYKTHYNNPVSLPANPDAAPSLRDCAATFGLSDDEFTQVVTHLGREPNALEAAMFGALWSEHCGYKNSRPLLKRLPTAGESVLQGPGENAGVVDIGEGWAVAFKMESHNHPSAVEPVQGAATGVGGILRDIFAMGARPFAVFELAAFW